MKTFVISFKIFLFLTILTGLVYPLLITGLAQVIFPSKANGSLIIKNSRILGSELIGQTFDSSVYFSSRPSAVSYNPLPSGGSNLGLTSQKLKMLVEERQQHFRSFNHLDQAARIPSEMLFASASGLDPHISLRAARLQVDRIVRSRKFNDVQKLKLAESMKKLTEPPQFGLLGEERINVLRLNLELDNIGQLKVSRP